ncbi:MAG: hypothetical protein ACK5FG_04555 [Chryseotalea sp.]|nr:hypothetical protein [Cytophagales bacterium]
MGQGAVSNSRPIANINVVGKPARQNEGPMKRWGFILTISLLTSCNTTDILIYSKNNCFERQLTDLKNRKIYKKTFASFLDTLKIVQSTSKTLLEEKADDGIFFKNDSLECLMLVLERENDVTRGFGSARVWRGQLIKGQWKWSKSMWVTFDNDYFKKYEKNTFDNISKVARYSVLTNGEAKLNGCYLDEYFWFTYMKN